MGSVQKRTQAGTTSWLARWRDPTGRQRKRSFPRRIDAERFLSTVSADLVHGNYIDPSDPTLFRDYAEQWRAAQVHRPTTRAHVETNLRRHAYPTFGDRRLSTIRPGEVQAWVAGLTQVLSPATVQVNHGLVAAVFKAAMRDRLVGSSPCEGTKLPKKLPREVVPLTVAMVDALTAGVPPRYRALVVLGAGTGLRQGECFGVVDDRLDLTARTLRVDQQLILLPRRPPFLAPPKTPASHRTIPLPQVVAETVAEHLERFPVHHPDRLIFTDEDGRALRRTAFSYEIWRPTVRAVGARRGTGFHELRHFTPRCSFATASRSRPCNAGSATPPPPRPSTPTRTCGPTPTTGRARRSTPCSAQPRHREPTTTKRERQRWWAGRTIAGDVDH